MWRSVLLELWFTRSQALERDAARLAWQKAEFEQLSDAEFAAVLRIAASQLGKDAVLLMCEARLRRSRGVLSGLAGFRNAFSRGPGDGREAAALTLAGDILGSRWLRMGVVTGLFLVFLKALGFD